VRRRLKPSLLAIALLALLAVAVFGWTSARKQRQWEQDHKLIVAVLNNDAAAVERLLDQGANADAEVENRGDEPSSWLGAGWSRIRHLPISFERRDTALVAVHDSIVKRPATSCKYHVGGTPLQNVEIVRELLNHGAKVNARSCGGQTALGYATEWDYADTARLLIQRGADVNAADDSGGTPLFEAATHGDSVLAQDFLKAGANPNARDILGDVPLWYAELGAPNIDTARVLLEHGADPTIRDNAGLTALDKARKQGFKGMAALMEKYVRHGVKAQQSGGRLTGI